MRCAAAGRGRWSGRRRLPTPAGSPGVTACAPHDYYYREPAPNGERIDVGPYGNTPQATPSPAQLVQIVTPNGLEKLEQGAPVEVQYRSSGLTDERVVLEMNVGGGRVEYWGNDPARPVGRPEAPPRRSTPAAWTTPARRPCIRLQHVPAGSLSYHLDVPDGDYTVRLHFADHEIFYAGRRVFDIQSQVLTVRSNYGVPRTPAGSIGRLSKPSRSRRPADTGSHSNWSTGAPRDAILSGIELSAANPAGIPVPTATLQLSLDDGATWAAVATGLAPDRFGRGSTVWTAGPQTAGYQGRLRLIADQAPTVQDDTDEPFLVTNGGNHYYVNDSSATGDVFTTAVGNNANTGKSPSQPMATLAAPLDAYDLDPGDSSRGHGPLRPAPHVGARQPG